MQYYAQSVIIITFFLQAVKNVNVSRILWQKVPEGWRWLVPIALGALAAFVQAAHQGMSFTDAVLTTLGIGTGSMGLNAALTDSPVPWNGGRGGKETMKEEKD